MLLPSSPLLCFLHSLCAEGYCSAGQAPGLVSPSPAAQCSLPGAAVPDVLGTNPLPLHLSISCNPLLLPVSHYLCLRAAPGPLPSCCLKFTLDFSADCLRCGEEKWHKGGEEPPGYLLAPVASNLKRFLPSPSAVRCLLCCLLFLSPAPAFLPSWPSGSPRGEAKPKRQQNRERKGCLCLRQHAVEVQTGEGEEDRSLLCPLEANTALLPRL